MLKRIIKYHVILLILCILIFPGFSLFASANDDEKFIITQNTEKINIYETMKLLHDKEEVLTIEDVSSNQLLKQFVGTGSGIPNFGYVDSVYWVHFVLHNTSEMNEWYLEVSYPPLEQITFYSEKQPGIFEKSELGAKLPFQVRDIQHRNHVFEVAIEKGETKHIFVRVKTGGSMQLPMTLWDKKAFTEKTQMEYVFLGIFYGVLAAMALYNLFLFFSLRHRSYLYYVLVIAGTIFSNLSLNGLGYQYIWSDSPWFNHRATIVFLNVATLAALLFAERFLDTEQYFPKFKKIAFFLVGLNAVNIVIVLLISYKLALNLMILILLSSVFSILFTAVICFRKGARQARFFLVAWVIFIIGIVVSTMADSALFPLSTFSKYAGQITAAIEGILLSFALADKINILRVDKEKAQLEARKSQARAVESLQQADKIKDEFLAITSHELRTPLYGIIGIAEGLRDGVEGTISKAMENQLSMIVSSGKRLTGLVDDILDFSKLKHNSMDVHLQQINLHELVNVVVIMCGTLVNKKPIKLESRISKDLPHVSADQNQLMQIFYNLIGNAIKYTNRGEVIITAELRGEHIKIYVSDTGIGISEEEYESIFTSFHQVDEAEAREVGGTGIGLSITKQLVELLGGTIEVDSRVGVGSTFSFTLPLYNENAVTEDDVLDELLKKFQEPAATAVDLSDVLIRNGHNNKAKILIADDEPVNLQVLINYLSLEHYDVVAVASGEEALKAVKKEQFDLLILDVMMPRVSGYDVAKKLRKRFSLTELPILILTAKNQLVDRMTSFEVGANDYLAKPCDKEELLARVRTLINLSRLTRELTTINEELEQKVLERTKELEKMNMNLLIVNEELKQVEQSRTMLLSSLSHELGTPITLIQNYIQAVQEGLIEADNTRYLEMIQQKVHVLNRLTNDLFELAKLRTGYVSIHFEEVAINDWMTNLKRSLTFDLERSNRLFTFSTTSVENAIVTVDEQRMGQAFSNLVWNAVRHTEEGKGKINITVEVVDSFDDLSDKKAHIKVSDNGVGIAAEDIGFIFDRFYKAGQENENNKNKGTGLGLAITKEIVTFHNGIIHLESEVGKGTTFTIELPVWINT